MNLVQNFYKNVTKYGENQGIIYSEGKLTHSEEELVVSWHNELEVIHIIEGEGEFIVDGKSYNVRSNSFVIINPDQLHSAKAVIGRSITYKSLKIDYLALKSTGDDVCDNFITPLIDKTKYLPNIILPTMPIHKDISNLYYQLGETFKSKKIGNYLLIKSYTLNLLYLFYSNRYVYRRPTSTNNKVSSTVLVRETVNYIHEHFTEDIDLDFMSINLNTSKPHLCRVFKRHTNQTITEYINDYRISFACDLLINTDRQIVEIAFQTGYTNLSYFNQRFKKKTYLTPKQYRNANKKWWISSLLLLFFN